MKDKDLPIDPLLSDALIRLSTLEKLLIKKKIFTQEEFTETMSEIYEFIARSILQRANVTGEIDKIIEDLKNDKKKIIRN